MNRPENRKPWTFFGLVFILSVPFWVAGFLTSRQILPALPVSALGFLCPVLAAAILVARQSGGSGVLELLKRSFDFNRIASKAWLAPLLLLQPGIMALSFILMRRAGVPIPSPSFSPWNALALAGAFFIAALAEELGWMGYAIEPLQERFGALLGSLIVGVVWGIWHFIPLLEAQRSWDFIAWWFFGTVAIRVIIVWLYNNAGKSVFVAAIYHTLVNLTWQLFPVNGSYYDPRVTGLILAAAALAVVIVWGPRTFTRQKPAFL